MYHDHYLSEPQKLFVDRDEEITKCTNIFCRTFMPLFILTCNLQSTSHKKLMHGNIADHYECDLDPRTLLMLETRFLNW